VENSSQPLPPGYRFSDLTDYSSYLQFDFGDLPFAVTVFAFPVASGHVTDWYVSACSNIEDSQPMLVLKLTMPISETDRWPLEGKINEIWGQYVVDLAYSAALTATPIVGDWSFSTPFKHVARDFLSFHLLAHDIFSEARDQPRPSKVEKTARWHLLLQSFGIKQTQQIIAEHESKMLTRLEGKTIAVNVAAINQRLQLAKKQGLLSQVNADLDERGKEKQDTQDKE